MYIYTHTEAIISHLKRSYIFQDLQRKKKGANKGKNEVWKKIKTWQLEK